MAAETASAPVNGNYAPHQALGAIDQQNNHAYANNNATASVPAPPQPPPTSSTPASVTSAQAELSKDEVGWYFVEQYYTTLSRNPERLYLFYNKRSQFVSGQEADKVRVYGGQAAINNRIKELEFKDCKVRVTNVDAQASESNIVIQVIGEMSNKSQPHKKFVQTFVLATQTNGYFVLNDIFRYLVEEEDELEPESEAALAQPHQVSSTAAAAAAASSFEEPSSTPAEGEQKTLTSSNDPVAVEQDAQELDRELEEKVLKEPEPASLPAAVNGVAKPEATEQHEEAAVPSAVSVVADTKEVTKEVPEKPTEPAPTPSPPKAATQQSAPAPKPTGPISWASMAASANKVATPVTPAAAVPAARAPSAVGSTKTATPPAPAASAAAPPAASAAPAAQRDESSADAGQGDEWTPVGGSHARQQSRQTAYAQQETPQTRAYIRNVHEGISSEELKSHLEQYGELAYFEVPRAKNSAFIEFRTHEQYLAAVNANPHTVSGDRLYVEERRSFGSRGGLQGGRGRGNMPPGQPRGNFNNNRGFTRGRGGNAAAGAARGRGGSAQAA